MNVDQQLHRAAHLVRELDVDVPEFRPPTPAWRRLGPPLLACALLVGGTATVMLHHPSPTGSEPDAAAPTTLEAPGVATPGDGASTRTSDAVADGARDDVAPGAGDGLDASELGTTESETREFGADGSSGTSDVSAPGAGMTPTVEEELALIRTFLHNADAETDDDATPPLARPDGVI